jgi:hypothetical protein
VKKLPGDACWEFMGRKNADGYGVIYYHGKRNPHMRHPSVQFLWLTNRLAWVLTYGPLSKKFKACHHCDNPPCCRPDHLFKGTAKDNAEDYFGKGGGGWKRACGMENGRSVMSPEQTFEMWNLRHAVGSERWTIAKISNHFGAGVTTIKRKLKNMRGLPRVDGPLEFLP